MHAVSFLSVCWPLSSWWVICRFMIPMCSQEGRGRSWHLVLRHLVVVPVGHTSPEVTGALVGAWLGAGRSCMLPRRWRQWSSPSLRTLSSRDPHLLLESEIAEAAHDCPQILFKECLLSESTHTQKEAPTVVWPFPSLPSSSGVSSLWWVQTYSCAASVVMHLALAFSGCLHTVNTVLSIGLTSEAQGSVPRAHPPQWTRVSGEKC